MHSDQGEFWDERYQKEGNIWGEAPSPTALLAVQSLRPGDRILDVGFGYGRDLLYLARNGCKVSGIDISTTGFHKAEAIFQAQNLKPEQLIVGRFEDHFCNGEHFDGLLSHRLAHLLESRESVRRFADKVYQVLRPGGLIFLAARNLHDLDPKAMTQVDQGLYEYVQRPGHRIRFWDEDTFRQTFSGKFNVLSLTEAVENESVTNPVPCHLSMMVGKKIA